MKKPLLLSVCVAAMFSATAQQNAPAVTAEPTGTVRAKFEYQPTENNARFSVRNARFGLRGALYTNFSYEVEVDLSDEGRIRMVDAYIGAKIYKGLNFNIGYMRVPFSIDAHRSPHLQLFANRSFIAKQMSGVKDVGATLGWRFGERVPVNLQAGIFNGSGLADNLRSYWTREFNYSAKAQMGLVRGMNFVMSYMTTRPEAVRINMYDAGITYETGRWLLETEYIRKEYAGGAFPGVNGLDTFICYGLPVGLGAASGETGGRQGAFRRVSFLGRWDYMGDHSNGLAGADGILIVNDPRRHRATAGITFSLGLPFSADIRLNYEKYFYARGGESATGPSDHDKIVVELMAHF